MVNIVLIKNMIQVYLQGHPVVQVFLSLPAFLLVPTSDIDKSLMR